MTTYKLLLIAAVAATSHSAVAQNTRVLLDTDRGPLLVELDVARAPNTAANFLRYVDAGRFDRTLLPRVVRDFVVQGGGNREDGSAITRFGTIGTENTNGLLNTPGTIAMALSGNPPNVSSASSDFYFNIGNNTNLDGIFTVFGKLVFGTKTLSEMNELPTLVIQNQPTQQPIRVPLVRKAVRVDAGEFPILPLHTGTWFDPDNSGKGFLIAVSQTSGSEAGMFMVVSWYDYFEGNQIWVSGIAPFELGASSVEVPLQITSGPQFGPAFNSSDVVTDAQWGSITLRFTGCDSGEFTYTSIYGDGVVPVSSLTMPTNESCVGN